MKQPSRLKQGQAWTNQVTRAENSRAQGMFQKAVDQTHLKVPRTRRDPVALKGTSWYKSTRQLEKKKKDPAKKTKKTTNGIIIFVTSVLVQIYF